MTRNRLWMAVAIIVIVLLLLLIGTFAYFRWAFDTSFQKTEIQEGFSATLLEELQTRYGITIPKDAQFIKGYNLPGWRDSFVAILFECPINNTSDSLHQLLKLDSNRYPGVGSDTKQFYGSVWYDELGGVMEYATTDNNFTTISYTVHLDRIRIRVIGWRPSREFP